MKKISINPKRFKYGTLGTVVTVVFIAVIVLINIITSMLIDRFQLKIDLTPDKSFTITNQTKDYLKKVDKDITITILKDKTEFISSDVYSKQASEIISKYSQCSDKIKVQYIDPDKNPEIMTKFNKTYKGDLSGKLMLIQNGDRIKAFTQDDLFSTNASDYSKSCIAEQSITSGIMSVLDANPKKVSVLLGDTVSQITPFTDLLGKNGYEIAEVDPLTGTIDQDSDLVIVNTPLNDYTQDEIKKLDKYLYNDGNLGKNIMYIASYQQKETPNLDAFLAEYGLQIGAGYTMDINKNNLVQLGESSYGVITSLSNEGYSADVAQTSLPVILPYTRPVNLLFETKDTRSTEVLLNTSDTAIVITPDLPSDTDFTKLPQGYVKAAAVGSKYAFDSKDKKQTSSILAVGSDLMLDNALITDVRLNNGDFMVSAINKLTGKSAGITIVPKNLSSENLTITQAQYNTIRFMVIILIPLIIVIAGIVVWVRRRNR